MLGVIRYAKRSLSALPHPILINSLCVVDLALVQLVVNNSASPRRNKLGVSRNLIMSELFERGNLDGQGTHGHTGGGKVLSVHLRFIWNDET